ncbi:MAG TPA: double-strand break repair helicase AddA [Xanthobacteraceae bacterium]|nr:double-strand break repair helicase AddA [Xanthobacteraceae bacterium]
MRTPDSIPGEVRRKQNEASDPDVSAWVAANAGSGKTYVLAQRVINLLLKSVEPEKILCVTFTKAAAANMSKQVFDRLAHWTTLDDAALDKAIREHANTAPDQRQRALARRLFARALETPGGLKVQTIHAFCTQLLHQFPFEANVAARFSVLDEAEQSQLLERLTLKVLLDGAATPDSALAGALDSAMTAAADQTFREVVREAIGKRDAVSGWVMSAGSVEAAVANLSRTLGVEASDSIDGIETAYFAGPVIAPSEWPALAKVLALGGKTDCEQADRFASLPTLAGSERVDTYLDIFCTSTGRTPRKSIVTGAIGDTALVERLRAEQQRVCALLDRRRAVACRDRSAALLTVAYEVLTRYAKEKERRGLLDYDDLIDKTLALLANVDAAWVHYKLDLGIDHVLVDEAQDTSHKQWDIVRRLTSEFTAGAGARSLTRTVFAVGDEKQSIYSFQDAAPKEFADMLRYFKGAHEKSGQKFVVSKFEHSFRSGEAILGAVDEVFKRNDIALSVTSDLDGFPPHLALPDAPPSVVEVWEPMKPEERKEIEGWDAPFDAVSETSPRVKLARRIARTVRKLVDERSARYGDVLILVRQRGELFEAVIRALKNQNVEVAGADRLMLTEHIAVMDLIALADALLLPEDDLALATVLRSPLFGFTDDDLFAIAWDRGRASLRAALARKAPEQPLFADAAARLDELAQAARRETPFAFYALLLGQGGARRRLLARLGTEANDAIDEFLNVAFDYERRETPSLQGFLTWLRDARAEVKRDMEIRRDEVRVMTVHGAKGLEAPIVILADTMTPPAGPRPPRLLQLADGATIWVGRKADDVPSVAAARNAANTEAEDEYRRLLYVAMTRAADRLIVCGADGIKARPKGCWYDLVRDALDTFLVAEGEHDEKVLLYRKPPAGDGAARAPVVVAAAKTVRRELPPWLRQPAPPEAPRQAPLSPSSAFEEEIGGVFARAGSSAAERQKALARGRIVHRLMQSLPDIPPDGRHAAIERYLKGAAADFLPAEQAEIARQVLTILNDLIFAEAFAPGSRAEVPIVGRIARPDGAVIAVSGQVDRLAVISEAVLVTDHKTDRAAPRRLAEVPGAYIAQLALYRAVLARIYPEKTIRAALVFTEGPNVMEVPGAAMEAALAEIMRRVTLQ